MRWSLRRGAPLIFSLALVACGEGPGAETAATEDFCETVRPRVEAWLAEARSEHPTPDDPRYGGTVVVGTISEIHGGMNAFVSADYAATQHQLFVNLMTLVDYDDELNPRPYLAESWEVSEDNTELTFHLRRDVRWHDGEATDAHDVAFTYLRMTDPRTNYPNPAFWAHYVPGEDGVEVVDDYTVTIRLRPHSGFMDVWRTVGIMPEHLLRDVPPEDLAGHPIGSQCPVGNGPFVFQEHRADDHWTFVANPAFPEALGGRPFVDRYVYRPIPDQGTLMAELRSGSMDMFVAPRPDQLQQIVDDPDLRVLTATSRNYTFIGWNARRPRLADPRVRRALTLGTDRETIVDALLSGYATVAHSSVPPFHWAYDESLGEVLAYDPDAARALLDAAGWQDRDGDGIRENADGLPLSISVKYSQGNQVRQRVVEIMQAQLADIGVEVRPLAVEWATLISQMMNPETRDFDGAVVAWITEFRVDDTDLFHSGKVDEPFAWSGTQNPRIDELLETLVLTVDRAEARPLWREYQQALAEEQPYTFLYYSDWVEGVNNRLRNVVVDPRGEWVNIKEWWIDQASR